MASSNNNNANILKGFLNPKKNKKRTHHFGTMNPNKSVVVASSIIIVLFLMLAYFYLGIEKVEDDMMRFQKSGGIRDIAENGVEMENLAQFAVEEHNKKENSSLMFSRLVKAREQVVSGMMYHLTLEATDVGGKKDIYETKVWVQSWINKKEMQEFKLANDPNV